MLIDDLAYVCDDKRHLICFPYSVENLHVMADDLGIKRCWFRRNVSHVHYDSPKRRIADITSRCTLVTPRELLAVTMGGQWQPI